jgi:hypothetical protein
MKSVADIVTRYRQMETHSPNSGILREVRYQYADMADGGDGGSLGYTPSDYAGPSPGATGVTCRAYNYPDYTNAFFQEVCDLLGWNR